MLSSLSISQFFNNHLSHCIWRSMWWGSEFWWFSTLHPRSNFHWTIKNLETIASTDCCNAWFWLDKDETLSDRSVTDLSKLSCLVERELNCFSAFHISDAEFSTATTLESTSDKLSLHLSVAGSNCKQIEQKNTMLLVTLSKILLHWSSLSPTHFEWTLPSHYAHSNAFSHHAHSNAFSVAILRQIKNSSFLTFFPSLESGELAVCLMENILNTLKEVEWAENLSNNSYHNGFHEKYGLP